MDDFPKQNTERQIDVDQHKMKAASGISERGARHFGGDPELARNFKDWDE